MTATKSYTFVAGTLIEAAEVNQNFDDIIGYINTDVIIRDASRAFTSIPTGPATDPTTNNQFTRKKYVDDQVKVVADDLDALETVVTNNDTSADTALALRLQGYYTNSSQTTTTAVTNNPKILVGAKLVNFNGNGEATVSFGGFTTVYAANVGVGQGVNGPMSVVLTGFTSSTLNVIGYDQVVTQGLDSVFRNIKWTNKQGWVSFTVIGR